MTTTVGAGDVLRELHNIAKRLGVFAVARVGEFRNAPPNGVCFAVWAEQLGAAATGHGLASTTPLFQGTARLYVPGFRKPDDDLEVELLTAADLYLGALSGGFSLRGLARNVDLLGEQGEPLNWKFGHINIDNKISRMADMSINVVLKNEWTQAE